MHLTEQTDTSTNKPLSYWSTIKQLNNTVDTSLPLIVFTSNKLAGFTGNRPTVSLNLQWYTYNSNDSVNASLVAAYKTYNDSIYLITATSTPSATSNSYNDVSQAGLGVLGYTTQPINRGLTIKKDSDASVLLDTSSLNIGIYAGTYPNDASYIKAAINAVKQFSKRDIKLSITDNASHLPTGLDWLFWLSDNPLPASISAKNVLKYETGKESSSQTWLTDGSFGINNQPIIVNKYIPVAQNTTERIIWQDGFGNPLLSIEDDTISVFHFYSRFNPSWNGLAWSSNFPQLILNLLINDHNALQTKDNRMIDSKQLQPYLVKEKSGGKKAIQSAVDLSNIIWLVVAIIFLIERIVAHKNNKEVLHAA